MRQAQTTTRPTTMLPTTMRSLPRSSSTATAAGRPPREVATCVATRLIATTQYTSAPAHNATMLFGVRGTSWTGASRTVVAVARLPATVSAETL